MSALNDGTWPPDMLVWAAQGETRLEAAFHVVQPPDPGLVRAPTVGRRPWVIARVPPVKIPVPARPIPAPGRAILPSRSECRNMAGRRDLASASPAGSGCAECLTGLRLKSYPSSASRKASIPQSQRERRSLRARTISKEGSESRAQAAGPFCADKKSPAAFATGLEAVFVTEVAGPLQARDL